MDDKLESMNSYLNKVFAQHSIFLFRDGGKVDNFVFRIDQTSTGIVVGTVSISYEFIRDKSVQQMLTLLEKWDLARTVLMARGGTLSVTTSGLCFS
jgi:hypothetical protein